MAYKRTKRIVLVKGARQSGKSTWLANNAPLNSIIISPTVHMSRYLTDKYREAAHKSGWPVEIWHNRLYFPVHNLRAVFVSMSSLWHGGVELGNYSSIVVDDLEANQNHEIERFKNLFFDLPEKPLLTMTMTPRPIKPLPKSQWFWFMQGTGKTADYVDLGLPRNLTQREQTDYMFALIPMVFRTEINGEFLIAED